MTFIDPVWGMWVYVTDYIYCRSLARVTSDLRNLVMSYVLIKIGNYASTLTQYANFSPTNSSVSFHSFSASELEQASDLTPSQI